LPAVRRLACVGWQGRGIAPLARWMGTSFDDVVREKVDANPHPLTPTHTTLDHSNRLWNAGRFCVVLVNMHHQKSMHSPSPPHLRAARPPWPATDNSPTPILTRFVSESQAQPAVISTTALVAQVISPIDSLSILGLLMCVPLLSSHRLACSGVWC
jgi:hypothetical protein